MKSKKNAINAAPRVDLERLLQSIQRHTVFDHPVERFGLLETHISCILLTGSCAYKFKKPVNPGFLDFSTLEKRKHFCEAEVQLNSRTAPGLYLGMVRFTGSEHAPELEGRPPVLEYAVKMRQFPERAELNTALEDGRLQPGHIDLLAEKIAGFHLSTRNVPVKPSSGTVRSIENQCLANLTFIRPAVTEISSAYRNIEFLRGWTVDRLKQFGGQFGLRRQNGFVRDCHGDLHLRNIILMDDEPYPFDCIEFSDDLRQIDVINDIAFLLMDLEVRGETRLAWRFLNRYLQLTGDYSGLKLLRFYKVYRALTRAKVECIRLQQAGLSRHDAEEQWRELYNNINKAREYTVRRRPCLIICHGLSGSGKSWFSRKLAEIGDLVWVRSDIERKRMLDIPLEEGMSAVPGGGIYSDDYSSRAYSHLETLAHTILDAGYTVLVDATFLRKRDRRDFHRLAADLDLPFLIVHCRADRSRLRSRIEKRAGSKKDISEADLDVLDYQIRHVEPLEVEEKQHCLELDTQSAPALARVLARLKRTISA